MTRCALYRHFDAQGRLLYVGISLSPLYRTSQHMDVAEWSFAIARIELQWHDDEDAARAAERVAIRSEGPLFNRQHARSSDEAKNAVADIIDALGYPKLEASLGLSHSSIRHARVSGRFPARWYLIVSDLCEEAGVECPKSAFAWVGSGSEA